MIYELLCITMEIFFLGLHDTGTFPYIMEKFLTDLHDI